MVNASSANKNLWVAASDGDIDRVQALIESGMSPNAKDANSYTPMHAAASYHHLPLLLYLLSVGGDINLPDSDGDTPLYTVESIEVARWMVEHGADPRWKNDEGLTPAEALEEDHPEVAAYLRSLDPSSAVQAQAGEDSARPSDTEVDAYATEQAGSLLEETQRIMAEAERDGSNPDERLREVVERAVRDGFSFGGQIGARVELKTDGAGPVDGDEERKRTRTY